MFNNFNVFPSCRTPTPTNYPENFNPHEPCSHCSNPYHSLGDCPHWGQFSNFSHEQMNTNFSNSGSELNSNFTPQTGATILISRGKLMLREIMLPNLLNCITLNIRSSIIHLPFLHHMTILLSNFF